MAVNVSRLIEMEGAGCSSQEETLSRLLSLERERRILAEQQVGPAIQDHIHACVHAGCSVRGIQ